MTNVTKGVEEPSNGAQKNPHFLCKRAQNLKQKAWFLKIAQLAKKLSCSRKPGVKSVKINLIQDYTFSFIQFHRFKESFSSPVIFKHMHGTIQLSQHFVCAWSCFVVGALFLPLVSLPFLAVILSYLTVVLFCNNLIKIDFCYLIISNIFFPPYILYLHGAKLKISSVYDIFSMESQGIKKMLQPELPLILTYYILWILLPVKMLLGEKLSWEGSSLQY